jgi:hypothetical protein
MKPNPAWLGEFHERMTRFASDNGDESLPVSIKLRIDSGCFCRNCAPEAHRLIEEHRRHAQPEREGTRIVEHESGPEILTYLALTTAGLSLTKSVIDLVVAIVKARSDGKKKGDRSGPPFELIIRRFDQDEKYAEEKILRIPDGQDVDAEKLSQALMNYSVKLPPKSPTAVAKKKSKRSRPTDSGAA